MRCPSVSCINFHNTWCWCSRLLSTMPDYYSLLPTHLQCKKKIKKQNTKVGSELWSNMKQQLLLSLENELLDDPSFFCISVTKSFVFVNDLMDNRELWWCIVEQSTIPMISIPACSSPRKQTWSTGKANLSVDNFQIKTRNKSSRHRFQHDYDQVQLLGGEHGPRPCQFWGINMNIDTEIWSWGGGLKIFRRAVSTGEVPGTYPPGFCENLSWLGRRKKLGRFWASYDHFGAT